MPPTVTDLLQASLIGEALDLFAHEMLGWIRCPGLRLEITVDRADLSWRGDVGVVTRLVDRDKLTDRAIRLSAAREPMEAATAQGERAKILVVEDDPLLSDRIELVLQSQGKVTTVVDGEGAISQLFTGFFDAIILDLMLPRLSGFDVIRHLMMRRPELLKSTIIVTGAQDSTLQFIDANELYAVLHKPFDFNELPRLVGELIARKQQG